MNKTKLEVIRINEDVIATSGVCQHPNAYHYKIVSEKGSDEFNIIAYYPNTGDWVSDHVPKAFFPAGAEPSDTKYYYPTVGGSSAFGTCEGSHDFSSYTEHAD